MVNETIENYYWLGNHLLVNECPFNYEKFQKRCVHKYQGDLARGIGVNYTESEYKLTACAKFAI